MSPYGAGSILFLIASENESAISELDFRSIVVFTWINGTGQSFFGSGITIFTLSRFSINWSVFMFLVIKSSKILEPFWNCRISIPGSLLIISKRAVALLNDLLKRAGNPFIPSNASAADK